MSIIHQFKDIDRSTWHEIYLKSERGYFSWGEFDPRKSDTDDEVFDISFGPEMQYLHPNDNDLFIYTKELNSIVLNELNSNKLPSIWKLGTIKDIELDRELFYIYENKLIFSLFGVSKDDEELYLSNMWTDEHDPDRVIIEDTTIKFYYCYAEELFEHYKTY